MINDSAATVLIVDAQLRPTIAPVEKELASVKALVAAEDETLWRDGAAPAAAHVPAREDDVAMIMYTSGTTGRPKGAMLTHGNFWWNNTNTMHALDIVENDVTLTAAPTFHIGGLNVTTLVTLQKGGLVVLHRSFDPGKALADIAAHRVTTMFGVPAMFQFMAQHPNFAQTDLSSVRVLVVGGAPCPLPVLKAYLARGVQMQQGYGLTETAPMVSFLGPEFALQKPARRASRRCSPRSRSSTATAGASSRRASRARCWCAGPMSPPAIGTCPRRRGRRSTRTAGSAPAMPPISTTRDFCSSATASRT